MNAYLISGLGADKRIFSKINLDESVHVIHIEWITPVKHETLPNYARRLSKIINIDQPYILIGVSFGGMIAVEMAKLLNPLLTITISSTVLSNELPFLYRLAGKLNLTALLPAGLIKYSNKFSQNFFFGTKTMEEKELLKRIINDTDAKFLKWAIGSIISWKNTVRPENLIHLHGSNDRILYSKTAKVDFIINRGTHFMVYQHSEEITEIINKLIIPLRY